LRAEVEAEESHMRTEVVEAEAEAAAAVRDLLAVEEAVGYPSYRTSIRLQVLRAVPLQKAVDVELA
jgi:hypothetical protein